MTTTNRTLALLVSIAALTALALPAATSAGDTTYCPDKTWCLWTKTNYQGKRLVVHTNEVFNLPDSMNNKASSAKNENGSPLFLYKGRNGNGGSICITMQIADLSGPSGGLDNTVSSGDVRNDPCE